jgi:hypothetical protein
LRNLSVDHFSTYKTFFELWKHFYERVYSCW